MLNSHHLDLTVLLKCLLIAIAGILVFPIIYVFLKVYFLLWYSILS